MRTESLAEMEKKYKKASSTEAEQPWTSQHEASVTTCSHAYWRANCRNVAMGQDCEVIIRFHNMVSLKTSYIYI